MKVIHTLVCVAVLTCLQLFAIAQGTKTGSPEDRLPPNITQLTGFGERASWSPDGKRIAFMRWNSTASPANGRAIFVVDADGTHVRRLTPWRLEAGDHPDWSPDGRRILFRSGVSSYTRSNLWTIRPDGSDLERLTDLPPTAELFSASYAPDGRWIVFSTTGRGGLPDLFAIRPDGTGLRQITRTAVWDSAPDWGPR